VRRIRLNELVVPDGWETRADEATNIVRAAAQANRSTLINNRSAVWGALKTALAKISKNSCWYCETQWIRDDGAVDHFRPKNKVAEDANHPGYWWLAFKKENYRFCCKYCNEFRVGREGGADGGKAAQFPLLGGGVRATCEADDLIDERAALLDPIESGESSKIAFTRDGGVMPRKSEADDEEEYERARASIEAYNLPHNRLVTARAQICDQAHTHFQNIDANYSRFKRYRDEGQVEAQNIAFENLKKGMDLLDKMMQLGQPYSGAVKSILSQEDKTNRAWLEELLA